MGCSHKKQRIVLKWSVPRSQKPPQIVTEDTYTLKTCDSCKAVAVDTQNLYCCGKGKFQGKVQP